MSKETGYMNIVSNAFNPIDFRDGTATFGNAEVIFLEALTSYLMRWTFGTEKTGFFKLMLIHALAAPLHGGIKQKISKETPTGYDKPYTEQLSKGMYGIPAVYLSQYIVNTPNSGIRLPGISIKDAMITAASKLVTKPIVKLLYNNGPDMLKKNLRAQTMTEIKQFNASAGAWK